MTTEAIETLEALAARVPLADMVNDPDWKDCGQTWAAYVPAELREAWGTLPREARLVAVVLGDMLVDRERFD